MKDSVGERKDDGEPNTELEGDEIFPKAIAEARPSLLSVPALAPAISTGNRPHLRHSYLIYLPFALFFSPQSNSHILTFLDPLTFLPSPLNSNHPQCLPSPDPSAPSLLACLRRSSPSPPSAGPHPPVSRGEVSGASPRAHFVSNPLDFSRMRAFRPPRLDSKLIVDSQQLN